MSSEFVRKGITMTLLRQASEIWVTKPNEADLNVRELSMQPLSMTATFNRMAMNTSSYGQQQRALNIAKGIVGARDVKAGANKKRNQG